jgi:hypothetical protein
MIVVKGKLGDNFLSSSPQEEKERSSWVHVGLGHWLGWILIVLVIIFGLG